jgi:hypothetical protein
MVTLSYIDFKRGINSYHRLYDVANIDRLTRQ